MGQSNDVVVLGGGLAGLASAYVLVAAGRQVRVLEKGDALGGLSRTLVKGGFRFDIGGHRWFTKNDELNLFLDDLLGPEMVNVPRTSHIYFDGKYIEYPVNLRSILGGVELPLAARSVIDLLGCIFTPRKSAADNGSFSMRDAYIGQFGSTLYEIFFNKYSEKVWGYPCERISGEWVVQRSRGLSLGTIARDALVRLNGDTASLIRNFDYPRFGIGQISESMGRVIWDLGGRLALNSEVKRISHRGDKVQTVTYEMAGRRLEIAGSHFISSIPINELIGILTPRPPQPVMDAKEKLSYRDLITVNVMVNQEQVTKDTWMYIHDPEIAFGRIHEPTNWSREMAPHGKTSLVAEYFCFEGDDIWNCSDGVLCEMTVNYFTKRLGFISAHDVIDAFAIRSRHAYPVYLMGYEKPLQTIKAYLANFKNLQSIGRSGAFRYNNMDHSVESGILAARNVLGENHDLDGVNTEKEYHETKSGKQFGSGRALIPASPAALRIQSRPPVSLISERAASRPGRT